MKIAIKEDFLSYIWTFQYFNKSELFTNNAKKLIIISPGIMNDTAGPDYKDAKIIINDIKLHGHVEIHVNASDWYDHKHEQDSRFNNVILHIVWNNDIPAVKRKDGTIIPTFELKNLVSHRKVETYKRLIFNQNTIPCQKYIHSINTFDRFAMLEKVLFERLTHKDTLINQLLKENNNDWEGTAFQLLASNFGFKINSNNFLELSKSIPYKILKKHSENILELESILFGQANLIPQNFPSNETYIQELIQTHKYLKHKYNLENTKILFEQWHFFRLRPSNFPTIRIAQFAKLLNNKQNIFDLLINSTKFELYKFFDITQSDYWRNHYLFLKKSKTKIPGLGKKSIENIMINSVVPLLIAYGKFKDQQIYIDKALNILQSIPPENNNILDKWKNLGFTIRDAFDSQAYLQLYNNYCSKKKCLQCNIGCRILGKSDQFQDLLEESLASTKK